jgi:thiol-disulfide isomerase/thioredoxin
MKKINRFVVFLLLCTAAKNGFAQKPSVTISGSFDNSKNGDLVQVSRPVGEYFNIFYVNKEDNSTIENGVFKKQIPISQPGFVRLQCKDLPKFVCYAEPGDQIEFHLKTGYGGNQEISFDGSNAKGNDLFVNRKLLNDGANDAEIINKIIATATDEQDGYKRIHDVLSVPLQRLENLEKSNEITDRCYVALRGETEQRMVFWCMSALDGALQDKVSVAMDKDNLKKLTIRLFDEFDPFNLKYRNTVTVANTAAFKCYLTHEAVLDKKNPASSKWSAFSSSFAATDSYFEFFDQAPSDVQQFLVGNDLLIALTFKPMSNADYVRIFKSYMSAFPESPYVPVIASQLVDKLEQSSGKTTGQGQEKMLKIDSVHHLSIQQIPEYRTLADLIRNQFKGRPVFVDFWATYCSPCIAEFKYAPQLNAFLRKKGIALLYVSVDSEGSQDYWRESVKNYQLEGYHYFSNTDVRRGLAKDVPSIPRYMIFNSEGQLVVADALQPSDKEKLYNQIKSKLGI